MGLSYQEVLPNKNERNIVKFDTTKEDFERSRKATVGEVIYAGNTYSIQDEFLQQGVFDVKVTPLGENLALLESVEDEGVNKFMEEAKDRLSQWFKETRPWSPNMIDEERLLWVWCYCIPAHAWSIEFFEQYTLWCVCVCVLMQMIIQGIGKHSMLLV